MAKLCEEKAANFNKEKKANLERERAKFQTELAGLHGLFADKQRRKEVEKLIEWIDSEINKLT